MKTYANMSTFLLLVLTSIFLFSIGQSYGAAQTEPVVRIARIEEHEVAFDFENLPRQKHGFIEFMVKELDGTLIDQGKEYYKGIDARLVVKAKIKKDELSNYTLGYRLNGQGGYTQRSFFFLIDRLETIVLGQKEYATGSRPSLRIIVRNRTQDMVESNAAVKISLSIGEMKDIPLFEGHTDIRGTVNAMLPLPENIEGKGTLKVEVQTEYAKDEIQESIRLKEGRKILLSTDKPLYQPGQTIHIRGLALKAGDQTPIAGQKIILEVEDSKGNKVFKKPTTTDRFGVASADFGLANELNMGRYKVRAKIGSSEQEKTVTVERYVLPKFKVGFKTQKTHYQPGDTLIGDIQADYFFGKPLSGAKVRIELSKFDVRFEEFASVEGTTDREGHYTFKIDLPDYFVGQPLDQGKAFVKAEIEVTDTAEHSESLARNITVSQNDLLVMAVPESGELIRGVENIIYLVTTYPDGTPAQARLSVRYQQSANGAAETATLATDEGGFGQIRVLPTEDTLTLEIRGADKQGNSLESSVVLSSGRAEGLLLRCDRAFYRVGDQIRVDILSTKKRGVAYLDLIKNGQTMGTRSLDIENGTASVEIDADNGMAGTVCLSAYTLTRGGDTIRDKRVVIVDPANDLKIDVSTDKNVYLPAEEATVRFKVTTARGRPVLAALGIMVVDESVFALQEMQPGMEKIYFYLEKELTRPRYEIHGYEIEDVFIENPGIRQEEKRREMAAKVLLAAAEEIEGYDIHVNTYMRDNKGAGYHAYVSQHMRNVYQKLYKAIDRFTKAYRKDEKRYYRRMKWDESEPFTLRVLVDEGFLTEEEITDPWGNVLLFTGTWCTSCKAFHEVSFLSLGPDGLKDTEDDLYVPSFLMYNMVKKTEGRDILFRGEGIGSEDALLVQEKRDGDGGANPQAAPSTGAEPQVPRVRRFFPETLFFNPLLITDKRGRAEITIPLADSITTWRMTSMASSLAGELGSASHGIRVFQDFFIDIDFPVSLTQNDEVSVPVAVYNYLAANQKVRLRAEKADWFSFIEEPQKELELKPNEVSVCFFTIRVKEIGHHRFTVFGYGTKMSDAVSRSIEVEPDGREEIVHFTDRLETEAAHEIHIPKEAIDGASTIFVKIYPGVFSQVIEGMDNIFRMPFGCFEQTSSVTYPNVLVLDYMRSTDKITPEIEMKAEGFIRSGYQRLLSYEVEGGGFEWFGNAPAHKILTAYGLMEFHDMSRVYEVDEEVISRTQQWLVDQQEKDGSWRPSEEGIREGAINRFTTDLLRNTAYITWALANTGYTGPGLSRGIGYIKKNRAQIEDNYTLALATLSLLEADAKDAVANELLDKLVQNRTEEGDSVYWENKTQTPTFGSGEAASIETTAVACQALLKSGRYRTLVSKITTYLIKKRDSYGTWYSTQATIQALKALLTSIREASQKVDGSIALSINGNLVSEIRIDEKNEDLLQLIDLKNHVQEGPNRVSLKLEGEGSMFYQIVGRYYLPYKEETQQIEPLSIEVKYDRTRLSKDDIVTSTVTIRNNRPGTAHMIIVDLGLPPGFDLLTEDLNRMVEDGKIEKFSLAGRQIIVYMDQLSGGGTEVIRYRLRAKYPLKAKTLKSTVYEYYNPDIKDVASPQEIVVE